MDRGLHGQQLLFDFCFVHGSPLVNSVVCGSSILFALGRPPVVRSLTMRCAISAMQAAFQFGDVVAHGLQGFLRAGSGHAAGQQLVGLGNKRKAEPCDMGGEDVNGDMHGGFVGKQGVGGEVRGGFCIHGFGSDSGSDASMRITCMLFTYALKVAA